MDHRLSAGKEFLVVDWIRVNIVGGFNHNYPEDGKKIERDQIFLL